MFSSVIGGAYYELYKIIVLGVAFGMAPLLAYKGHGIQGDRLKEKGYAKTTREGDKMAIDMARIVKDNGDTSFFYKELRDKVLRCHRLAERIAELEQK